VSVPPLPLPRLTIGVRAVDVVHPLPRHQVAHKRRVPHVGLKPASAVGRCAAHVALGVRGADARQCGAGVVAAVAAPLDGRGCCMRSNTRNAAGEASKRHRPVGGGVAPLPVEVWARGWHAGGGVVWVGVVWHAGLSVMERGHERGAHAQLRATAPPPPPGSPSASAECHVTCIWVGSNVRAKWPRSGGEPPYRSDPVDATGVGYDRPPVNSQKRYVSYALISSNAHQPLPVCTHVEAGGAACVGGGWGEVVWRQRPPPSHLIGAVAHGGQRDVLDGERCGPRGFGRVGQRRDAARVSIVGPVQADPRVLCV